MKRVMCVHLPEWPLQRWERERPELRAAPFALMDSDLARSLTPHPRPLSPKGRGGKEARPLPKGTKGKGARVVHCNHAARQRGVHPNMPLAEARAIIRNLRLEEANPATDLHALERLAEWAERFSPLVALEEGPAPESLLLDVTGSAAYFHGEDNLARRVERELRAAGWTARVAIADTLGAAWAVAHFGANSPLSPVLRGEGAGERGSSCRAWVIPSAATEQVLRPLPTAALRLPMETLCMLAEVGIERIEQLLDVPRADLPGRFGAIVLERLDQALKGGEVLRPHRAVPAVQAHQAFDYGIERLEMLYRVADQLVATIAATLESRQRGTRKLECWLHLEKSAPLYVVVSLSSPSRSAAYLAMLLRTRLEQHFHTFPSPLSPEYRGEGLSPILGVSLRAAVVEPITERQADLFESDRSHEGELATLIDRLSNRLGPDAVTRPMLLPDAQPEYACRFEPLLASGPRKDESPPTSSQRPLRLWPKPREMEVLALLPGGLPLRFRLAAEEYGTAHAWGPERIATGWWRGRDVQRDYFILATQQGPRFWIFRRHEDGRWFVHGCFD